VLASEATVSAAVISIRAIARSLHDAADAEEKKAAGNVLIVSRAPRKDRRLPSSSDAPWESNHQQRG